MKIVFWCLMMCGVAGGGLAATGSSAVQAERKEERKGVLVTLDDLKSPAPAEWVAEDTKKPFRIKQFRLPATGEDKDSAEVVMFYFGEGGAGSVADNIKRWKAMFIPPEGKKIDDVAKVENKKINGMSATYFDVNGTYLFKARPMDTEVEKRPDYRMLKIVLDTKKGPYFFSLVGPKSTVTHYKKGFSEWVEDFK